MPVFTFEKISPPARSAANAPAADKKHRGVIFSILDRFAEARSKQSSKKRAISARKKAKA